MTTVEPEVFSSEVYQLEIPEVVRRLETDDQDGLTTVEAQKRLEHFGPNILDIRREKSLFRLLLEQFISPLIWVLMAAAVLAFSFGDWLEGVAILAVILINAGIGFFMEWQALRSMEALRKLSRSTAKVFRQGTMTVIASEALVPGDLIFLEAGDMIPADCRVLQVENLGVKEAALTGESNLVKKQRAALSGAQPLHDRSNLLFKGTTVNRGNGRAIVFATGKHTQLGAIAHLVQSASKEATPLEQKLRLLSQKLLWITLLLALIIFLLGFWQGRDLYLMIKTAVALAVAAIPEGLPIVATIALARGMLRLARQQVIVKKLSAVQTLGETQIIFTDKTGTLTENRLSADTIVFPFGEGTVNLEKENLNWSAVKPDNLPSTEAFRRLLQVGVLCNNARLDTLDEGEDKEIGDPLEIALLQLAARAGMDVEELRQRFPRHREIPFDSDSKMMGTLHHQPEKKNYLVCVKGALEVILPESDYVLGPEGKPQPLPETADLMRRSDELAAQGLRVLALAYSEVDQPEDEFFHNLIFIGFVAFIDPPRIEVRTALQTCRQAGVRVIMVTGDHPATARFIAWRTGLVDSEKARVINGSELSAPASLSAEERAHILQSNIFARVSPAQKLDLVAIYQDRGLTVGMTGDGVNDTPALKKADIGIAMGSRGTEAAKEVADLILKDDSFNSIVLAIRQGRGIFENIRLFVIYLLSCNLSELLVVGIGSLNGAFIPLLPLQILFLNMVTDVFPALALGMNREAEDIMDKPPRPAGEAIVNRRSWIDIVIYAAGLTAASLGVMYYGLYRLHTSAEVANNLTFYTLILAQLWHVFNLPRHFFRSEVTHNPYIWWALLLCLAIVLISYSIPLVREVLFLQEISWSILVTSFLFSLIPIFFIQLFKLFRR